MSPISDTPECSGISRIAVFLQGGRCCGLRSLEGKISSIPGSNISCGLDANSHRNSIICDGKNDKAKYLFFFRTPIWCFLQAFRKHLCLDYAPALAKWCYGTHLGLRTPILSHRFSKCHSLFAFFIMSLVTFFFPWENLPPYVRNKTLFFITRLFLTFLSLLFATHMLKFSLCYC